MTQANHPPIMVQALEALIRKHHQTAISHTQQETPMPATLNDAIHAAISQAVSDILDRLMTAENLAAATLDEVRAQQPALPAPPPPADGPAPETTA